MMRQVQPEILDNLPPDDPGAVRSRKDLRLINVLMNHTRLLRRAIHPQIHRGNALRVFETGAGDGSLAGKIWKDWGAVPKGSRIDFVDKAGCLSPEVKAPLELLGWEIREYACDVFEWVKDAPKDYDIGYSSLFLHHFEDEDLRRLLRGLSRLAPRFICAEPRRDRWGLMGATGLRLLGCNEITLNDSKISVRAGFHGQELSSIWNSMIESGWQISERRAGLFTHFFSAIRSQ
ncbi:MAG: hypothetical protein HOH33_01735 [Verrucomicrobia bacterium]|jgi:hypothetical protein|nr:hypothetical protein [Verrucomicrobiota bacterium]